MALVTPPTSSNGASSLSLEDELAEATQDLLNVGKGASAIEERFLPLLHSPSPLLLNSRAASALHTKRTDTSLDVKSALSIDPNARLTPVHDDDASKQRSAPPFVQSHTIALTTGPWQELYDGSNDHVDPHLPSARLHQTIRSVHSSGMLSAQHTKRPASVLSPGLVAAQESLRSHSWLNERGERVREGKIERKMALLENRLHRTSPSLQQPREKGDSTPTFFRESFPDYSVETAKLEPSSSAEAGPSDPRRTIVRSTSASSHLAPFHISSQPSPAAASMTDTSVTVLLHGNRRAERMAAMSTMDRKNDDYAETTLASIAPDSPATSPIDEIEPHPMRGDDSDSLISLPATTATPTSGTSNGRRRRPNHLRRRRSIGSQSQGTSASDLEVQRVPFARNVQIRGFSVVGEKARGYVSYDVRITTQTGSTMSILRRFSSFVTLRRALITECKQNGISASLSVPQLPPRGAGLLHKYASDHLEKRRRALQTWLSIVMLDPVWGTSVAIRQWVIGSDDQV